MRLTDYHAKYFAHELTGRCSSDSLEKLAGAVAGAQVDLNPDVVLGRCEWGKDNYSLELENLPKPPEKPGQVSLFEDTESS